jgi:dihydropteroate synthase
LTFYIAKIDLEDNNFPMIDNIRISKKLVDLVTPKVMSILNCTPDSFYEGSRVDSISDALFRAEKHIHEGADILDIGGYSSRPGADEVSENEELNRVISVIESVHKTFPEILISCDTFRGKVASEALGAGAHLINDISGGELDKNMINVIAKNKTPYILMHSKGTPQTMQNLTNYNSIFKEVVTYFSQKLSVLQKLGINDVILDPGFGFAKTLEQNYELFHRMADFQFLGKPILVGISRKSMIYKKINCTPEESLNGTTVLHTKAILSGAKILRVHDTKEAKQVIQLIKDH